MSGLTTKPAADLISVSEHTVKVRQVRNLVQCAHPGWTQRTLPAELSTAQAAAHTGDVAPCWQAHPALAGHLLRVLREVAGLNQLQLAARAGLSGRCRRC